MSTSADLDRYAESLDRLSAEVQTRLAKIHDFNNKIHMISKRTDLLVDEYFEDNFPSEAKKTERMIYIKSLFAKTRRYAEAKETLSKEMCELVNKSAHRLDSHLTRYRSQIQAREELIRNAPDHHSEERRLERDIKEAQERKRQEARERKNKKEKDTAEDKARGHHKEANEAVVTERMENNISCTSHNSDFAINSCMNNMHITEKRQPSFAENKSDSSVNKDKKSRMTDGQSDQISRSSPHHSSKEKISSQDLNNKKLSSRPSSTHSASKNSSKSSSGLVRNSESLTNRHNSSDKKSTSSKPASNKKPPSDYSSSDESSDDNHDAKKKQSTSSRSSVNKHDAKDKKLTGPLSEKKSTETNEFKKSKSSNSSHRKSVDASSAALKKSNSSTNRVKSSSDKKISSKSKSQKENKDTKKRTNIEKLSKDVVKKPKLSVSSTDEEEFDIPADPNEPVYCYCQKVSYGDMVACDNDDECDIVWFHFGCVGLKSSPPGKWYCTECAKKRRDNGKTVR